MKKGYLAQDEYVSFSEQSYGIGVAEYCSTHTDNPFCFGGPAKNQTSDGRGEWLYYLRNTSIAQMLPDAICPYQPTDDKQFECDGREAALASNPVKFTIESIESAYSLDGIRRLLFEKQVPLYWSHAVYEATYTIPCTDENAELSQTQMCRECMFPCKQGCCAKLVMSGYGNNGIFDLHAEPYNGGGHAMIIVGYNDDYRVDNGLLGDESSATVGGFIIKNSWGPKSGHSIAFWSQEISAAEEEVLCPNGLASSSWLPVSHKCMMEHADPVQCGSGRYRYLNGEWKEGGTVLRCNTAYRSSWSYYGFPSCNETRYYALAASPLADVSTANVWTTASAGSDGYVRFNVVSWPMGENVTTSDVKLERTLETTWNAIEKVFVPVEYGENDPDFCGFWFIPYQYFQEGNIRYHVTGHDTPQVSYVSFKWDDRSYVANEEPGFDYTLLKQSTHKQKVIDFDGPYGTKHRGMLKQTLFKRQKQLLELKLKKEKMGRQSLQHWIKSR